MRGGSESYSHETGDESKTWTHGEYSIEPGMERSSSPPPPPPPGNPPPLDSMEQNSESNNLPYKKELAEFDSDVTNRLADKVQKQALELLQMQDELDSKQAQIEKFENRFAELGLRDAHGNINRFDTNSRKNSYTRQAYQALEARFASTNSQVDRLVKQNKELRYKLQGKEKAKNSVEKEVYALKQEVVRLKAELSVPSDLVGVSKSLLCSNDRNKMVHASSVMKGGGQRVQQLEEELAKLRGLVEEEGKRNEKQRVYIKVLETAVQTHASDLGLNDTDLVTITDGIVGSHGDSEGRIRGPEGAGAAILITVESLKQELANSKDAYKKAKAAVEEKERKLASELNTSKGLRLQLEVATNKLRDMESKLKAFQGSDDQLIKTISSLSHERDEMLSYIDSMKKKEVELENDLNGIRTNLDKVRDAEAGLMAMLKESQLEVDEKHEEVKAKELQVEELKAQCDDLELKLRQRDMDLESIEFQLKAKDDMLGETTTIQEELIATAKEKGAKLQQATEIAEELQKQVENANLELKTCRNDIQLANETIREKEQHIEHSVEVQESLQKVLEEVREKNKKLEVDLAQANDKIQVLGSELEQTKSMLSIAEDEKQTIIASADTMTAEVESGRQVKQQLDSLKSVISQAQVSLDCENIHELCSIVKPVEVQIDFILPELSSFIQNLKQVTMRHVERQLEMRQELEQVRQSSEKEVAVLRGELVVAKSNLERIEREKRYLYETNQQLVLSKAESSLHAETTKEKSDSTRMAKEENDQLQKHLLDAKDSNSELQERVTQLEKQLVHMQIEKEALAQVLSEAAHEGNATFVRNDNHIDQEFRDYAEPYDEGVTYHTGFEGDDSSSVHVRVSRNGAHNLKRNGVAAAAALGVSDMQSNNQTETTSLLLQENEMLRIEHDRLQAEHQAIQSERDNALQAAMEYKSMIDRRRRGSVDEARDTAPRSTSRRGRTESFDSQVVDVIHHQYPASSSIRPRAGSRDMWKSSQGPNTRCTVKTGIESPAQVTIKRDGEVDITTNRNSLSKGAALRQANAQAYAYLQRANRALKVAPSSNVARDRDDDDRWQQQVERTDRIRRGHDIRGRPVSPASERLQRRLDSVRNKLRQSFIQL